MPEQTDVQPKMKAVMNSLALPFTGMQERLYTAAAPRLLNSLP